MKKEDELLGGDSFAIGARADSRRAATGLGARAAKILAWSAALVGLVWLGGRTMRRLDAVSPVSRPGSATTSSATTSSATTSSATTSTATASHAAADVAATAVVPASAPTPRPSAPCSGLERIAGAMLPDGRVVLNLAGAGDLRTLPGIGDKRALAILELRRRLGRFRSLRDLLRVKGVGIRMLRKLESRTVLDPPEPPGDPLAQPGSASLRDGQGA